MRRNITPIRIIIGAAKVTQKDWLITDEDFLNLLRPLDWERLFKPNTIDAILAEHVWEHLTPEEGLKAAKICFKYLRKGGYLRIAVPDGLNPKSDYINYVKPGGTGPGSKGHKVLYNYFDFKNLFEKTGFSVKMLEYFDENGKFNYEEWKIENGMIKRSKRFDKRNKNGKLNYTSLILDAVKNQKLTRFSKRSTPCNYKSFAQKIEEVKIFIVIPVHNRKNLTRNCLFNLYKQTYGNFEIVICDDGSTDGTSEMIKKQFPEVVLLKGNGNLYWSGAYNKCLTFVFEKADEKDYILSLNNDVEVDENYLFELCKAAKDNSDKLIMSVVYDKENRSKIVDPGYNINLITMRQHPIKKISPDIEYVHVNSVYGRGLLIPVKIAKKAGFADSQYFLQMGDYDLSFRYQKSKIKAVICNKANIYSGPSYTVERYFNNYSLKNFFNYITDIKSAGNLKYRFWAIVKNRPLFLIPINLFFDFNCIIFGYFKRWVLKKMANR